MTNYLNSLLGINIPVWAYAVVAAALILLVVFLVWFIRVRIFKSRLKKIIQAQDADHAEEALKDFELKYPAERLVRYSGRMERYSRHMGPQIVRDTGLADKWVQKLTDSVLPSPSDLRRVLLYCPEANVFKAFIATSSHPRLRDFFFKWVKDSGEEKIIRLLGETCRGEEFDPAFCAAETTASAPEATASASFIETQGPLLRELTSESEWYTRYFAYKMLLLDKDVLTEKVLEEGLMDPHPLIRKILTNNFTSEKEKTWNVLWDKLIHDPVYEVRETARKRIAREFTDTYSLNEKDLTAEETARILEQLDPSSQEDRTFAMTSLENDDKELRYHAAAFLDKYGTLSSYLAKNTLDDPNGIEQSVNLLQKALEVNVSGFLRNYETGDGAPLLTAARLLSDSDRTPEDVCYLEEKVFAFFKDRKTDPSIVEIYTKTLEAVVTNGNVKAFELLREELYGKEMAPDFLQYLLPAIPKKAESMFSAILFRFLENTAFPDREGLVRLLGSFSPDIVLPEVFRILDGNRAEYPHMVRISALKIMGHLKLPFCLQRILESLPTFIPDEAEGFASLIASHPRDMFEEKAGMLLASPDAKIRASLITILPIIKNESFIKEIKASLKDVDPDVRVAAIKALLGFGEIRLLNQETSMLRDPVERVRIATAEVIAKHGNAAAMEILKKTTTDENETDTVKISVITGLGQSTNAEGIPILVNVLDSSDEFREHAVKALAMRTSKRDITKLVEIFKDAEPQLREKLIPVFKAQGKEAEPWILEILKDEVASLKPYLVKILEETGYVDRVKRRLSHRNAEVRREAAQALSLLDTLPAFRGLVMAAKDPDQEVRVAVVKALEKLKSSQSQEMLEQLKADPDNRIRKYTFWALERLESLKME